MLVTQDPVTIAHEVLITVTVDLRRVRPARRVGLLATAIDALAEETRLLVSRLESAGITIDGAADPGGVVDGDTVCDPIRRVLVRSARFVESLGAAVGKGGVEWGPMAVEPDWFRAGSMGRCIARTGSPGGRCCRWRLIGWRRC